MPEKTRGVNAIVRSLEKRARVMARKGGECNPPVIPVLLTAIRRLARCKARGTHGAPRALGTDDERLHSITTAWGMASQARGGFAGSRLSTGAVQKAAVRVTCDG